MPRTPRFRSSGAVIIFLAFLGTLMATGIDISLPAFDEIDADLGGGSESLIVTTYLIGAGFGQLVSGPLSDAIGRQRVLLGGLALYVVGAAACALAPSFGVLLAARVVWGVGAAAPTGMRSAIARDLYSGDEMARVTTIMMAVFMLGPIFTPLVGEALLSLGPWPLVFWFAVALGVLAIATSVLFGETLEPERRRPLDLGQFRHAWRSIVTTRVTFGHIIANVFWSAAFFVFLASAQPVIDQVFGRADDFAFYFALLGVLTIPPLLINNLVIKRIGARKASLRTAAISLTASWIGVFWLLAVDATPSFWLWFAWVVVASSFITLSNPPMYALALEPMGDLAGTVSSLLYFTAFAIGSALATVFNVMIEERVLPFVLGFAVYGLIGFLFQLWAGPAASGTVEEAKGVAHA